MNNRIVVRFVLLAVLAVLAQSLMAQQARQPEIFVLADRSGADRSMLETRKTIDMMMSRVHPAYLEQPGTVWAIQMGAFTHRSNAVRLSNRLRNSGYRADVFENYLDGKDLIYLVWVGSFRSLDDVTRMLLALNREYGIEGVVRERSVCRKDQAMR